MSSNAKIFCATMIAISACFALSLAANAQNLLTKNDLADELVGLQTTPNIDVAALRARALDRVKKNVNRDPVNRPAISEQLYNLPQLTLEIQFNLNSAIINPNSYPALGRIADAMYHPILSGYRFLVVGHTDSTGKREYNLGLSQR